MAIEFRVKICGVTIAADCRAAVECGADAIGLNFYPSSLRCVSDQRAKEIVGILPPSVCRVGVFVNADAEMINGRCEQLELDSVQLHGDESPSIVSEIDRPVVRAFRLTNKELVEVRQEIAAWQQAGAQAILLDSGSGARYGGTGLPLDWGEVAQIRCGLPLILAGGLNCENVAEAISIVRPFAVDVAGGVEKFPGAKDARLMRRFVEAAKTAFKRV
jgi:phosphoribosylanthranilate isomerase